MSSVYVAEEKTHFTEGLVAEIHTPASDALQVLRGVSLPTGISAPVEEYPFPPSQKRPPRFVGS